MLARHRTEKYTELIRNRIVDITITYDGDKAAAQAIHKGAVYATANEGVNIHAEIAHAVRQRALQEERDARARIVAAALSASAAPAPAPSHPHAPHAPSSPKASHGAPNGRPASHKAAAAKPHAPAKPVPPKAAAAKPAAAVRGKGK